MNYKFKNNVLVYSAIEQANFTAFMLQMSGYETISTFFGDLSIAEYIGIPSIKETFKTVCESWKHDCKMFTEFVLALNHKSWEWSDREEDELTQLYIELYEKAEDFAYSTFTSPEDQSYIFNTLD